MFRRDWWMKFVAVALIFPVVMLNTQLALFAANQDKPTEASSIKREPPKLREGKITGKVTRTDGKTPLPDTSITVIDAKSGKTVATVKTDKKGRYSLSALKPGKYRLVVGHRMVVQIEVVPRDDSSLSVLNILVPDALLSRPAGSSPPAKGQQVQWYTTRAAVVSYLFLLGGGSALLVGGGGGGGGAVSPSVP
jgi:hypothetical protein